jgi:hypothetical protein
MRRFVLIVAALALGLAMVGTAEAASRGGSRGGSHNYHLSHGTKFKGGYFYKGKNHYHWSYRYWWGKYGCYSYYCPSTCCWYYWYPQDNCYYPCSYIRSATPVAEAAPAGVATGVTQIVNVNNNSPGGTAGASATAGVMPPAPPG